MHNVKIRINGKDFEHEVESRLLLVSYLRERARLKGTHIGCDTGHCGACTVLCDGQPVKSCMVLAVSANGKELTTIEGLAQKEPHPVQKAFQECFAIQCGYCTPGMVMSTCALLARNPGPSETEIRRALAGNLCMCTGYQQIVDAVARAAEKIGRGDGSERNPVIYGEGGMVG